MPDHVIAKFVLLGELEALSPLMVGTGSGDVIDAVVQRGYKGNLPFIPATALAGVLRHNLASKPQTTVERYFWGDTGGSDSGSQSHLAVSDLLPVAGSVPRIVIRDGIRIDSTTGIVADKAKFNFEVVEPGATFAVRLEATVRGWDGKQKNAAEFESILCRIKSLCEAEGFSLGAMTTRGFGRLKLKNARLFRYDFPADGAAWFAFLSSGTPGEKNSRDFQPVQTSQSTFSIFAMFAIKSSLIIGSAPDTPDAPDKSHLQSNGAPVLSGTSLRGAVRSRAERIAATLGGAKGIELLKEVFGWVDPEEGKKTSRSTPLKSRISIDETIIKNVTPAVQSRIRIDRFTGGVAHGALFDSMPLWNSGDSEVSVKVRLSNFTPGEDDWIAGLLLQVLKDLWSGDLPVGGEKSIGRGVLMGKSAEVSWCDTTVSIDQNGDKTVIDAAGREELNRLAAAFGVKMGGC